MNGLIKEHLKTGNWKDMENLNGMKIIIIWIHIFQKEKYMGIQILSGKNLI